MHIYDAVEPIHCTSRHFITHILVQGTGWWRKEEFNNNPWTTNLEGTDQSLQDFVVAHFEENPIKISYFIVKQI